MRYLSVLPCLLLAACAAAGPPSPSPPPPPSQLRLAQHGSATVAPGVTLTFEGVEDSRCPPDVRCVWAGSLSYRFSLQGRNGPAEHFALLPDKPGYSSALLGGARIELDPALVDTPPPRAAAASTPVTLRVTPA